MQPSYRIALARLIIFKIITFVLAKSTTKGDPLDMTRTRLRRGQRRHFAVKCIVFVFIKMVAADRVYLMASERARLGLTLANARNVYGPVVPYERRLAFEEPASIFLSEMELHIIHKIAS